MLYAVLAVGAVLVGIPFVYMFTGSFKPNAQIFAYPLTLIPTEPTLINYQRLFNITPLEGQSFGDFLAAIWKGQDIPFVRQYINSIFVSVVQTTLTLLVACMVGWGFAKYEFRGKRYLFFMLLATLTLPFQMVLVPLFLLMFNLGWLDNYLGVIVPGAISAFGAFFMRQNMVSIPGELLDAARIDGASEWGIFWRIGIPLSKGALSVLGLLTFLGAWNDYLWPVIVLRTAEKLTLPIGLAKLVGLYKVEYGMILAGAFLAILPILAIFLAGRNQILSNLTVGAIKQ